MTEVRRFVADLAMTGISFREIKELQEKRWGDLALKKTQIYAIIKKVKAGENAYDQRSLSSQKTKRTASSVAAVAAAIEEDRRFTVRSLVSVTGLSTMTIHRILKDDLGLVKKSARWVPKLLSDAQKKARVERCEEFLRLVRQQSKAVLNNIVTMDESAVSFHTPETKQQSKQWLKKGQPGPIKARVHASRQKQMLLAYFDAKGVIYTDYVPKGKTVNAKYIIESLRRFLKIFKQKRKTTASQEWFLHWDNAPVHSAAIVKDFIAAKKIKTIAHPPYSPDLAPADFFLFPKVKNDLAGKTLRQEIFRSSWEGAIKKLSKDDFAAAFEKWMGRCEKCISLEGGYVEKS